MSAGDTSQPNKTQQNTARPGETERLFGLLCILLALFVGFFVWQDRAQSANSWVDAGFSTIGVLSIFGIIPFVIVIMGAGWRQGRFSALEGEFRRVSSKLDTASHGNQGFFDRTVNTKEVEGLVQDLIGIYSRASGVSSELALPVIVILGVMIFSAAGWLNYMASSEIVSQNQANLMVLFVVFMTFAAYFIVWPGGGTAARRLDPSGKIARLIALR